ncbi:GIY-YIG nuclease family protein [Streptomyces sp. B21-083]|uniref:GIY-YIG nuclease family protein n=1 Tax=Streptomyces sp. B21-083 TaxID=3039410 RepID=UPI002FEF49DC
MIQHCEKRRWERGHHAIVSLDGEKAEVIGCLECDWDSVVYNDLGDNLTDMERFEHRYEQPTRCIAINQNGTRCKLRADGGGACDRHEDRRALWNRSYAEFRSPWSRVSLPEAYREVFIRAIRDAGLVEKGQQVKRETFERARDLRQASVVYFVERDGLIKIGTTTNLHARIRNLGQGGCKMPEGMTVGPVTLLASTPGDRLDESNYHERFRKQRVGGEWFRPNKALLRLVEDLQRAERSGNRDILDQVLAEAG